MQEVDEDIQIDDSGLDTLEAVVGDTLSTLRSVRIDTVSKLEDRLMTIEQCWTEPLVITDDKSIVGPPSQDGKKLAKTLARARSTCLEPSVTMDTLLAHYAELLYERTDQYPQNIPEAIRRHLERHGYHR